ncbi:RING-CH-type domain-containing protein [Heracleum sosnowskyi]|uniref:RING-CH-type domain-containing protein n=1 Tax=Heracleum sosnowskyi TaxID=360622 RepID=A0AAD8MAZ7_9APIA|nr:RING-CH-type domain-containing protein [Heracleum sosnowskyi]
MSSLAMTHLDLECGGGGSDEEEEGSVCFSEGSCYSQFYSTADGSNDDYTFDHEIGQVLDSRRVSSVVESECWVDDKNGIVQVKVHLDKVERDCRICQLSLDMDATDQENGIPIELGCSCKDDLAAAHKHCAEAWFKIKGNKICEICNAVARNVVGPAQQANEANSMASNAASGTGPFSSTTETRTCLNGHRFLNFLLACMVFAFVISWLFHFNIPS